LEVVEMTTATAPRHSREILSTEERGGERFHRYRWTTEGLSDVNGKPIPPSSGEDTAAELIEPLSREILLDRWEGLTGDGTKLRDRLVRLLFNLAEGLTRRDMNSEALVDGEIIALDIAMDLDGLDDVIRDWMLERAGKVAAR
jgi:hypothetical protein